MPSFRRWIILSLIATILSSCSKEKEEPPKAPTPKVTTPATAPPKQKDTTQQTILGNELYKPYKLTGARSLSDLSAELGPEKMFLLYKINRRDLKHLKEGETIVIPNGDSSQMSYSPFPDSIAMPDSVRKVLIVSRRVQAFAAYENGKLVKWGPTSTGKKATPTPEGLYHTNWKSKETHSTVDDAWVLKWYFNLDNLEGISLHEYELPGYPASHSCVRLLSEDAQWIYDWAEQWKLSANRKFVAENGTPVIVYGEYPYGKKPIWKKLDVDSHATDISEKELIEVIGKYLPEKKVQLSSY